MCVSSKWWEAKKRTMQAVKDAAKEAEQKKEQAEKDRLERVRQRYVYLKGLCGNEYRGWKRLVESSQHTLSGVDGPIQFSQTPI